MPISQTMPLVKAVTPNSPADLAGVSVGDVLLAINGEQPRDVIQYQFLTENGEIDLEIDRSGLSRNIEISKADGEPLGIEVQSALFDQLRTCDNHCSFCFIYQLPPNMRKSLYQKDDDYRLSFLYGNFTTLTRFTEADLERVISEGLSPLYVSIHATDHKKRNEMLRNRRGGPSLRWLRALLDHDIEVHGQIVVCPGINDSEVLDETLAGVLDWFPELKTVAVVPLGVSDFTTEPEMRPHTIDEANRVVSIVESWQETFLEALGRRVVYAADEYYLLAKTEFPEPEVYGDFEMHEDGIGMARNFENEFLGFSENAKRPAAGFFSWVDGAPPEGYRAPRSECQTTSDAPDITDSSDEESKRSIGAVKVSIGVRRDANIGIITGTYGAEILRPLLTELGRDDLRLVVVENKFFGGNIGVTGLLVGEDIARHLSNEPLGDRYLLPDVCLSGGVFLDGQAVADLPRKVEVVNTDGISLRRVLESSSSSLTEAGQSVAS